MKIEITEKKPSPVRREFPLVISTKAGHIYLVAKRENDPKSLVMISLSEEFKGVCYFNCERTLEWFDSLIACGEYIILNATLNIERIINDQR